MARKEEDVTVTDGRDAGKAFHIKEWPAMRVENWVLRAVFGLGSAGVEIPSEVLSLGAGPTAYVIASKAVQLPTELGLKLAAELMECVTIIEPKLTRSLVDNDVEDFTTLLWLKGRVLKLTFGFFLPAASPTSMSAESGAASK